MYATVAAWAVDFARALYARPKWAQWLFRISVGRYAYREFVGLVSALDETGMPTQYDYDLENMEYHHEHLPLDWRQRGTR